MRQLATRRSTREVISGRVRARACCPSCPGNSAEMCVESWMNRTSRRYEMFEQIGTMQPIWGTRLRGRQVRETRWETGGPAVSRGAWAVDGRSPAGSRVWRPRRALDVSMRGKEKETVQKSLSGFASHHLEGSTLPSTSPVESISSLLFPSSPHRRRRRPRRPDRRGRSFPPNSRHSDSLSARSETSYS